MYERFGIDRDPDVRRARFRRVEEDQVARLKVRPLHRHANRKLLDHGSGNHTSLRRETRTRTSPLQSRPVRGSSPPSRYGVPRSASAWSTRPARNNHGRRGSTACRTAGKWGRADRATGRCASGRDDRQKDQRADQCGASRDSHTEAIGGGSRPRQPIGQMLINHCNH